MGSSLTWSYATAATPGWRTASGAARTKDTGLRNLPFHDLAQNAVWLELVALAQDLLAHTQRLALTGHHRTAEPKKLRYQLFHTAGRLVATAGKTILRLSRTWPWAPDLTAAFTRLAALPAP